MVLGIGAGVVVDMITFDVITDRSIYEDKFMNTYVMDTLLKCGSWLSSSKYDLCQRIIPGTKDLVCHYKGRDYTISVPDWDTSDRIFAIQDGKLCYVEGNCVMNLEKKRGLRINGLHYEISLEYSDCSCFVDRAKKPDDTDCIHIKPSYLDNDVLKTFSTFKVVNNKVFVDDREYTLAHWVSKIATYRVQNIGGIDVKPQYITDMLEGATRSELLMIIDIESAGSRDDIIVLKDGIEYTGIVFTYENSRYVFDLSAINDNYLYSNVVILSLVEKWDGNRYIRVQIEAGAYLDVSLDGFIEINSAFNPTKICIKTDLTMKQIKRCILLGDTNKLIKKVN